jgi:hypothetical protein
MMAFSSVSRLGSKAAVVRPVAGLAGVRTLGGWFR